jgi:hypothetical protein
MVRLDSSESFKNKLTPVTFPPGRFKRDNVANGRGGRLAVSPIFAPSRHRQTARSQSRNWNTRPAAASTGAALSGRPCQEQIWGDRMRWVVADIRGIGSRHALCGAQPALMVRGSPAQEVQFQIPIQPCARVDPVRNCQKSRGRSVCVQPNGDRSANRLRPFHGGREWLCLLLCRFSDAGNHEALHALIRPASEKRQGTKSRM